MSEAKERVRVAAIELVSEGGAVRPRAGKLADAIEALCRESAREEIFKHLVHQSEAAKAEPPAGGQRRCAACDGFEFDEHGPGWVCRGFVAPPEPQPSAPAESGQRRCARCGHSAEYHTRSGVCMRVDCMCGAYRAPQPSGGQQRRPTIAELEQLLNSEDDTPIEILPNGDVRQLGPQPQPSAEAEGAKVPLSRQLFEVAQRLGESTPDGEIVLCARAIVLAKEYEDRAEPPTPPSAGPIRLTIEQEVPLWNAVNDYRTGNTANREEAVVAIKRLIEGWLNATAPTVGNLVLDAGRYRALRGMVIREDCIRLSREALDDPDQPHNRQWILEIGDEEFESRVGESCDEVVDAARAAEGKSND